MQENFLKSISRITGILLILNIAFFALSMAIPAMSRSLALYYFESPFYRPYQIISHIFMHGGIAHLVFNVYALAMFGSIVEKQMKAGQYLFLYFFSAMGAFLLHMAVVWLQLSDVPQEIMAQMQSEGAQLLSENRNYRDAYLGKVNLDLNRAIVGASGAIMGVLAAFAYFFPNVQLSLIFLPVPIKAKYFVPIYMVIELFLGVNNFKWDNIAHFAHLGGAIFGFIAIFLMRRRPKNYSS